jgi:hypothetical protein
MLKILICSILLSFSSIITAQETKTFNVGDAIEYFDGVDWIDGEIAKVNSNNTYVVYVRGDKNKTKVVPKDDVQALFMEKEKIITTTVTKEVETITNKFSILDIVKYHKDNVWIESEIINIGKNNEYLVYENNEKTSVVWKKDSELSFVRSIQNDAEILHKVGDVVFFLNGEVWHESEILALNDGLAQVYSNIEKTETKWIKTSDLKKKD